MRLIVMLLMLVCGYASAAPQWFLAPPLSDQDQWYGAGSGPTSADARQKALADVAQQITTTLQSQYHSRIAQQGDATEIRRESRVQASSETIAFSDPQVVQQSRQGETTFVLVRVDREAFIQSQLQALQRHLADARQALSGSPQGHEAFLAWARYDNARHQAAQLIDRLGGLSPRFDDYPPQLAVLAEQKMALLSGLRVSVQGPAAAAPLLPVLRHRLAQEGILVQHQDPSPPHLLLLVTPVMQTGDANGNKVARLSVTLSLKDYGALHDTLAQAHHEYWGRANGELTHAMQQAHQAAAEDLAQDALKPLLSL
ncbi:LPP20 family lipoprotein [Marinobacter hydrocarbonoclasticus]|nr:LPP20 family lipoprotein [Marinobacter nauticus]